MSLKSRKEYLAVMRERYCAAQNRRARSQILDEVLRACGYHRKYAIRVLGTSPSPRSARSRRRQRRYTEALPAIALAWEALDYPCAERLHPVLRSTVEQLAAHGELTLTPEVLAAVTHISRATLGRRLAEMPSPKPRRSLPSPKPALLRTEIAIGTYDWNESRPGALEVDLVEHNGGSVAGHYAYTLHVVDIVAGWSRRLAILGRGQASVHAALDQLLRQWPYPVWALHTDNGAEFVNHQLLRYTQQRGLAFTRSRPYRKNDNAHVEQRNRQLVREIMGYARYDQPDQVAMLNRLYALLDVYANLFLPTRKLIRKQRCGSRLKKAYDTARTPFERARALQVMSPEVQARLEEAIRVDNPLRLHRQLEALMSSLVRAEQAPARGAAD